MLVFIYSSNVPIFYSHPAPVPVPHLPNITYVVINLTEFSVANAKHHIQFTLVSDGDFATRSKMSSA